MFASTTNKLLSQLQEQKVQLKENEVAEINQYIPSLSPQWPIKVLQFVDLRYASYPLEYRQKQLIKEGSVVGHYLTHKLKVKEIYGYPNAEDAFVRTLKDKRFSEEHFVKSRILRM